MTLLKKISSLSCLLLLLFSVQTTSLNAQVFLETFDEGNGATAGTDDIGGVTWTSTCLACVPPGDYFEIQNGQLEGQDTNGPASWETTSDIDISSCDFFEITVDIEESGDLEACGTGCNSVDWVMLEYNIDGTGWVTPSNATFCAGPCADVDVIQSDDIVGGGPITYTTGCVGSGSTLRLRITVQTWAGTEQWRIDNVTVNCTNVNVDAGPNVVECNGSSVTLTAQNTSGGTISWNNGVNNGTPFTPSVGSLYYTVTETLGGCVSTDSTLVTIVEGPTFTLSGTPSSSCTPPFDGTIILSDLSPGTTYDVTYTDQGNVVGPTSLTADGSGQIILNNIPPGFYSDFIVDSLGCIEVNTIGVQIDPPITPQVDAGADQTVCEGDQVTLTAFNPDMATITWNNGVTDGVPFTPAVGSLTYTVTADIGGCTSQDSVVVTVLPQPTANVPPHGPYPVGGGVQTITGTPAGGTWTASCGGCIDANTGDFDPAVAGIGMHTICYTVGTAPCEDSMCIDVFVTDGCTLVGVVSSNNPTCYQFNDGSATINIQGAVGNVVFVIEDTLGNQVNTGNSNTANNLSSGWYYFTVTDDAPCTYVDSVFLQDPGEMQVSLIRIYPSCYGIMDGMAIADTVLNYTGDYNQISYVWSPNSGANGIGADTLSNAGGNNYNLLLTDENGCAASIDFNLPFPDSLYFTQLGTEPAYCRVFGYQSGNGVVYAAAAGGTPDYDYTWINITDPDTNYTTTWGGLNPGTYQINVVDDNGCILSEIIELDSLNPIADFDVTSAQFLTQGVCEGTAPVEVHFVNQSQYFANPNNPQADTTFFWNFGFGNWTISHDYFEEFDTVYTTGGTYDVCLVAINKNGCSDTLCKPITVFNPQSFTPINVFTPNGDGDNDEFNFGYLAEAIVEFNCVIVNRWGKTIIELTDINQGWDGTDQNGSECVGGVYFYIYSGTAENGETIEGQGNVHLIR